MSIKLKKIQQSTTAFQFAEGLHGKAEMHSFFYGREHGPYNFTILNKYLEQKTWPLVLDLDLSMSF